MKCKAKTKSGAKCKNNAIKNSKFCRMHAQTEIAKPNEQPTLLFAHALYYPYIEIPSEDWLKTAALYWNTISTIVPISIRPYKRGIAKALSEAGVLQASFVEPDMPLLEDLVGDVIKYMHTDEGQAALLDSRSIDSFFIHYEKISRRLREYMHFPYLIHNEKFALNLFYELRHSLRIREDGTWVEVPYGFGNYYMTLLASRIASTTGRTLLTDRPVVEGLANRAQLGHGLQRQSDSRIPTRVAEGLLATLALKTVNIGPGTSAKKLLTFRDKYAAERGRFRTAIRKLVSSLSGNVAMQPLAIHVQTIFQDEVLPSIDELRGRLRDHRITCGFSNLKLSSLASTSPTVIGGILSQVGLGPFALFAGVGLSIVLQTSNYSIQKRDILRGNPFSYVLSTEKAFGRKRRR